MHENRFIRFHAMQSLLFYADINIAYIALFSIAVHPVPFLRSFAILAFLLVSIVGFVGLLGALGGSYIKLPFVGDIAECYAYCGGSGVKY